MYVILQGSCNVHVDAGFDDSAQASALQRASLALHGKPSAQKGKVVVAASADKGVQQIRRVTSTTPATPKAVGKRLGSTQCFQRLQQHPGSQLYLGSFCTEY